MNGSRVDHVGVENLNSARWGFLPRSVEIATQPRGALTVSENGETRSKKTRTRLHIPGKYAQDALPFVPLARTSRGAQCFAGLV